MRLAIVGIRGLPNTYGGFETLADYLVEYLNDKLDITVYCSSKDMDSKLAEYKGAKLSYIPVTSHGAFGIVYDSLSLISAIKKADKILFLGFGGGFVMPFLSRKSKAKIILNIGGLDWKRNKWSPFAQKVIKKAEALLVGNCNQIVSDNRDIQKYIKDVYGRNSTFIAYGGDQAIKRAVTSKDMAEYSFLKAPYAFSVTRIQPDNNIDMILEAFIGRQIPLVMVGNWNNSAYGKETKQKYTGKDNLILLDAIYDREKLDIIRSNCSIYIHGHSAGGTNPSLVEAMYLSLPVMAYASGYNEATTNYKALYFQDAVSLAKLANNYTKFNLAEIGNELKKIADVSYRWDVVTAAYLKVINQ